MPQQRKVKIGIIGGSGLDDPDILENRTEIDEDTPYGKPSDKLIAGVIKGVDCILLARHGRKHDIMPSNVNYRANIMALKQQGCTHVIVTNACGSLKEEIHPGDVVFINQFIDRTTRRQSTFYDGQPGSLKGICHIPMHTPFCTHLAQVLCDVTKSLQYQYHPIGTIVVIEGPRFSTKAESNLYRSLGADLVGMTTVPEVVLAKEAGLSYAAICLATDYDCWKEEEEAVSALSVLDVMKSNSHKAKEILLHAIPIIAQKDWDCILQEYEDVSKSAVI